MMMKIYLYSKYFKCSQITTVGQQNVPGACISVLKKFHWVTSKIAHDIITRIYSIVNIYYTYIL